MVVTEVVESLLGGSVMILSRYICIEVYHMFLHFHSKNGAFVFEGYVQLWNEFQHIYEEQKIMV